MTSASSAIPAATLILFRDRPQAAPELLMVERARAMAFAPGALVFPGGRVDPDDRALAEGAPAPDEAAYRIAAIRETIEEAGVPIGFDLAPTADALATMRAGLHAGRSLAELLGDARLDLDRLVPFARWLPQHPGMRIFDTRFYLAQLPADAPVATVDRTENVRLFWATAADVLAQADAGRATIIFPTRRNLERLARFAAFADAVADARAHPVRIITPWEEERADGPHLCIPDDAGYPVTSEPMRQAVRG